MLTAISPVVMLCSSTAEAGTVAATVNWSIERAMDDNFIDRLSGGILDAGDLLRDFIGRARRLIGERLHFGGDHRVGGARDSGARRFDGGVERQQVGL